MFLDAFCCVFFNVFVRSTGVWGGAGKLLRESSPLRLNPQGGNRIGGWVGKGSWPRAAPWYQGGMSGRRSGSGLGSCGRSGGSSRLEWARSGRC